MKTNLNEMSFKSDLVGLSKNIETLAIITAENPFGIEASKEDNNKFNSILEQMLKEGRYVYRKVIGQYNSKEHSYIISNVSLSEIKNIAASFKQESFIFGSINSDRKRDETNRSCIMLFEYWQIKHGIKTITADTYEKLDDVDRIVYTDKAIDFFTRRKNFKFNLPFSIFESMSNEYCSFNIPDNIMESIKNDLHKNMSGRHLWKNRAMYYKKN